MTYYDVYVVDRCTKNEVCIGALLNRSEASKCMKFFEEYDCDAYIISYYYKNGKRYEL